MNNLYFLLFCIATVSAENIWQKQPYLQNVSQRSITITLEYKKKSKPQIYYRSIFQKKFTVQQAVKKATLHHFRLKGLLPETVYVYYIAHRFQGHWYKSPLKRFWTSKKHSTPFRFFCFGDNQYNIKNFKKIINEMENEKPKADFLLSLGDIVQEGRDEDCWQYEFHQPLAKIIATIPIFVTIGNHELWGTGIDSRFYKTYPRLDSYDAPRYRTLYNNYIDHPGRNENRNYYHFVYGNSIFIILDSNFPHGKNSQQFKWLQKIVNSSAFQKAKWRFVALHHPFVSRVWSHRVVQEKCLDQEGYQDLLPLVKRYRVDFVLSGHSHSFQAGHMIYNGHKTYFITSGGAGAGLDRYIYPDLFNKVLLRKHLNTKNHHFLVFDINGDRLKLKVVGLENNKKIELSYSLNINKNSF